MHISNKIHYSTDAYLLSRPQYEAEHKSESQAEKVQSDISSTKLEEKLYAKSINALQPTQVATDNERSTFSRHQTSNSAPQTNSVAEKAITSYTEVENNQQYQEQFNMIEQMV